MKPRLRSLYWVFCATLAVVLILSIFLLSTLGVLPTVAGWQPNSPDAITNQQKAAILGGQNLLELNKYVHWVYLPALER